MESSDKEESILSGSLWGFISELLSYMMFKCVILECIFWNFDLFKYHILTSSRFVTK